MEERGQNVVAAQRDQNGRQEAIVAATLSAYYEAMPEARIIETVAARFGCRRSTVRRCITGLNMLEAEEIPARALEVTGFRDAVNALGGGRPYLRNLRRERNEFLRSREQREGGDLWRAHQQSLSEAVDRLARMDGLALGDANLAAWLAGPSDTWELSEAVGVRDGERVAVRPRIAEEPVWGKLLAHLPDPALRTAVEQRSRAIERDLGARIALFRAIRELVESPARSGGLGIPVTTDKTVESRATTYYVFRLLAVLLARRLHQRQPVVHELEFKNWAGHSLQLGSRDAVFSPHADVRADAKLWFLKAQHSHRWRRVVEVATAARAYDDATRARKQLQDAVDRLRLAPAYLAQSRCEECQYWAHRP